MLVSSIDAWQINHQLAEFVTAFYSVLKKLMITIDFIKAKSFKMKKVIASFGVILGSMSLFPFSAKAMFCGKQVATKTEVRALTAADAFECAPGFSSTQIAWLSTKQIVKFDGNVMQGLSANATKGWTAVQIQQMSQNQLKGLIESKKLTATQLKTVTARYKKLTSTPKSPPTTVKKSPSTTVKSGY